MSCDLSENRWYISHKETCMFSRHAHTDYSFLSPVINNRFLAVFMIYVTHMDAIWKTLKTRQLTVNRIFIIEKKNGNAIRILAYLILIPKSLDSHALCIVGRLRHFRCGKHPKCGLALFLQSISCASNCIKYTWFIPVIK